MEVSGLSPKPSVTALHLDHVIAIDVCTKHLHHDLRDQRKLHDIGLSTDHWFSQNQWLAREKLAQLDRSRCSHL